MNIWRRLGINQKISIVLSIIGIMAAVSWLIMWSSKPNFQLLYSQMDRDDLGQVVSYLDDKGIAYQVGINGSAIFVPLDKVYTLRMELAAQGLPSEGNVGFEIFDETNFGVSDFVQKTNFMRAVQGELSRTISQLKGIRSARVMISVPENRLLAEHAKIRPTGSVFVATGGKLLSEHTVNSIRFLVAHSVEGLNVDDVVVVDSNGNSLSESLIGGVLGGSSGQLRYTQGIEDYFSDKIESMLSKVVGRGKVVAKVSVKVDTETSTTVEEIYDPSSKVVRSQTVTESTSTSDDMHPVQITGIVDNNLAGGAFGQTNQPVSSNKDIAKKKTIAYEISRSKTERVKIPGKLQEIQAAVFLAMRYTQEGEEMVAQPRGEEEIEELRKMIVNALGVVGGDNEVKRQVILKEVEFYKEPEVQAAGTLDVPDSVYEWIGVLRNFTAIGVSLVMFFIFFKMLKSSKPRVRPPVELVDQETGNETKNITTSSTVDLINKLVQQKPKDVSTALKSWASSDD